MASSDPFIALNRLEGPAPETFQVLGERSSGTNYVTTVLKRNLPLEPDEVLGWKHGFAQMLAVPRRMLVVAVVREAFAWTRSMHAKPWHVPEEMQRLSYSDFIRAPWKTTVDRHDYFALGKGDGRIGAPLQPDRDPITGRPFANLVALRNAKAAALLGFANRDCHFAMLRLEVLQADPEQVLGALAARFRLTPPAAFRPVTRRLGSRFAAKVDPRPAPPAEIGPEDRAFILSELDTGQEARLGYRY